MSGSEDFRSADQVSVTAVEAKAPSNAFGEVLDFCSQTMQHPEARIRQTGTVLQGIVVGGIKDIPNELMNHPLETCGKIAVAGSLGVAAGAALALEIPAVTAITIGTGLTMLGVGIYDSFKRMSSDRQLQSALRNVWVNPEPNFKTTEIAEKVLGPEAFNWGVTLPAGLVGGFGGNIATKMVAAKLLSGKPSMVPVDTPEVIQIPAESTVTKAPTGSEQASSGNVTSNSSPNLESSSPKHPQQNSSGEKTAALTEGGKNYTGTAPKWVLEELAGKKVHSHTESDKSHVYTLYTDGTVYRQHGPSYDVEYPDGRLWGGHDVNSPEIFEYSGPDIEPGRDLVRVVRESQHKEASEAEGAVSKEIAALARLQEERLNSPDEGIRTAAQQCENLGKQMQSGRTKTDARTPIEQNAAPEKTGPITFAVNAKLMLPDTIPGAWKTSLAHLKDAEEITIDGSTAIVRYPDGATLTLTNYGNSSKFETNKTPEMVSEEAIAQILGTWIDFSKGNRHLFNSLSEAEKLHWKPAFDKLDKAMDAIPLDYFRNRE